MLRKKFTKSHGSSSIQSASHVISEFYGLNKLTLEIWIDFTGINIIEKLCKPDKKTMLHEYIKFIELDGYGYYLDKHFPMVVINEL